MEVRYLAALCSISVSLFSLKFAALHTKNCLLSAGHPERSGEEIYFSREKICSGVALCLASSFRFYFLSYF